MNTFLLVLVILNQGETSIRFSAGSMEIIRQDTQTLSHLYNGVEILYGNTQILADEGFYNEEDSTGYLVGNVRVFMESSRVKSDTLWFNGPTGEMRFSNQVEWVDTVKTIQCNFAKYKKDTVKAWGNIVVNLIKKKTAVLGDTGIFFEQTQTGKIWGNTRLVVYNNDTIVISADTFLVSEDTIAGVDGIMLTSNLGNGTAKKVKIFENHLLLIDSSSANWDRGRINADTIVIFQKNDTLTVLKAKSNSILFSEEDSSSLTVEAYEISMNFVRDSLESIIGSRVIEGIYNERKERKTDTEGD